MLNNSDKPKSLKGEPLMAFTADSVELAKANKLGNQLAHLFTSHGLTGAAGTTGAKMLENYARKLGFGITGLTTGAGFPPFGTVLPSYATGMRAALQNPRGETMANGIVLGALEGQTVGIYLKKFVRNGADYRATMASGVTLALSYTTGNTFTARGPISVQPNDRIVFSDAFYVVAAGGATSAAAGGTAAFRVNGTVASTYATGAAFDVTTVGVTRGTSGIAGSTFEGYARGTRVNNGFTAAIYYTSPAGGSGTWTVS
jgi:hypothetical protein